jgi:Protein of unknown function (DUF1475)
MKAARVLALAIIALLGALMLAIVVQDSFRTGIGMDRFQAGLADPWQRFIGFDLMSGLFLMFGWIVYRQRGARRLETVAWVLMANWWGNIVVAAYILVALYQARGEAPGLFMGARGGELRRAWTPGAAMRAVCAVGAAATVVYVLHEMAALHFAGLPAWAFVPAFGPLVLSFALLAFPEKA